MSDQIEVGLEEVLQFLTQPVPEVVKKNFYCTFNPQDGAIIAISGSPEEMPQMQITEISYDDGIAFMTGRENYNNWYVVNVNSVFVIKKKDKKDNVKDRVELLTICEFDESINSHVDFPDVKLVVKHEENLLEVHYNGDSISSWKQPMKLFLTRLGDPSHLICSLKLDINTLDSILAQNNLKEWPNPVVIQLDDADDISIFGNRYTHQVRLIHDHGINH